MFLFVTLRSAPEDGADWLVQEPKFVGKWFQLEVLAGLCAFNLHQLELKILVPVHGSTKLKLFLFI